MTSRKKFIDQMTGIGGREVPLSNDDVVKMCAIAIAEWSSVYKYSPITPFQAIAETANALYNITADELLSRLRSMK
jgi:hypothetical protein